MNLYWRELNVNKKGLIIWTLIVALLLITVMAMYPTMAREADQYMQILNGMSDSMQTMYNSIFGLDKVSMTDLFGFYSIYASLFLTLTGAIYAMTLGSSILSKEENDRTIEFLLARPVTRREIVTGKLLAYLSNVVIFNLVISLILFATFEIVKQEPYDLSTFVLLCLAPLLLHLTYAAFGFLLSVFVTKSRINLSLSLGIVFLTYFIGIISGISEKLSLLKYLSPFKYVECADIITKGAMNLRWIVPMLIVQFICIALAYFFYNRKDITV